MTRRATANDSEQDSIERALLDFVFEIAPTYRRLIVAGLTLGTRTAGGGYWWIIRRLKAAEPQTVPELARFREISRQHVQVTVNYLVKRGLVETIANPNHKRSKLVRLSAKGRRYYTVTSDRIATWAEQVSHDLSAREAKTAAQALRKLRVSLRSVQDGEARR